MKTEDLDEMTVNEVKRTLEYQKYESSYNKINILFLLTGIILSFLSVLSCFIVKSFLPIILIPLLLILLFTSIYLSLSYPGKHKQLWGFGPDTKLLNTKIKDIKTMKQLEVE